MNKGILVRLMMAPGTSVSAGQSVMELETDKAVVEVPSSVSGTVQEIRVKVGEKVKVGQVIFTVENGSGAKAAEAKKSTPQPPAQMAAQTGRKLPIEPAPSQAATAVAAAPSRETPSSGSAPSPRVAAEFKLPELGENISQGDLVRLMISPGTKVAEGQPVMELETDKAVVEVPSSVTGVVKDVKVKEGEKIKVGQVIFTLEGGEAAPSEQPRPHTDPVEHTSGQHGARLAFQAAIRAEGKTEEQALPPDQPAQAMPSFSMPAQLGKVAGTDIAKRFPPRLMSGVWRANSASTFTT